MTYSERVADALNKNRDVSGHVYLKGVRDRYEQLRKAFNQRYLKDAVVSVVGEEVGEEPELLGMMRKAREEEYVMKNKRKGKVQEIEKKKIAVGARLVEKAIIYLDE